MLNQNSSRVVSGMQDQTVEYVTGIVSALCWYWWKDPYTVMQAPYSPQGMEEIQIDRQVHPADDNMRAAGQLTRHGPFEALDIQIDPYSLQHQTPQEKMAAIDQIMTTVVIPLMPLLQQQGISVDMNAYLKLKSKLLNIPELPELVTMSPVVQPEQNPGQEQPGMPAQTERKYVRENRSERTQQGTTQNLMTALAGVHPGGNSDRNGMARAE